MHQALAQALQDKFSEVLAEGVFSAGKEVDALEKNIGKLLGLPTAIACSNGTDALELALRGLGIGHGDEVIVPALTWASTAEAVVNVGAQPVFCDVDKAGLIAVPEAEKRLSSKTRAVIPVHLYGKMVDMTHLMDFAGRFGLKVIEDAAQALGASLAGRSAGTWGDVGCFSFYPTKNLGALGEAGLMTTSDKAVEKKIRIMLNHGQSERDVHPLVGRNSKIDSLQAGFLNVKLSYFKDWQNWRKKLAGIYLDELQVVPGLWLPESILGENHNAHLFTIRLEERDGLRSYLEDKGIGTAIHYPKPLPLTEAFGRHNSCPMAEKISNSTLSLPLHPFLKEEEVLYICRAVRRFFLIGRSK